MGIRTACRQIAARTSVRSLLVVPFIILAAACSENATEPVAKQLDATPSLSLADAQLSGSSGPIRSGLAAGKCMAYDSNGAIIDSCDGSSSQKFTFKSNGSIVANSGACLTGDNSYAARVRLRQCDGSAEQKWTATSAGELRGIGGKCVGVAWNKAADGTKLVLWTCNGTDSQKWDAGSASTGSENVVSGDLSVSGLTVATGKAYKVIAGGTKDGAVAYIDRTYQLTAPIPAAISGATYIRPSNDDKFAKLGSSSFMSFTVNQDVDVYVAFDNDPDLNKPSWLTNGFTKTSTQLATNRDGLSYTLYKKSFAKGTITLGANTTSATDGNMYVAIIVPKGGVTTPPADTSSTTTPPADTGGTSDPAPSDGSDGGTHSGIFVSPSGSSSASGTQSSPMSLSAALSGAGGKVSAGDTVWVRAGR
ncbi:MAG TPA: RICIN domain-containing protein, partial [Gemmatimonadaceae bacterium]